MRAYVVPSGVSLDYTHIAAPLCADEIKADIDEVVGRRYRGVDSIVLWEHQVDWLQKNDAKYQFVYQADRAQRQSLCAYFGVPIKYAEPDKPGRGGESE